MKSISTGSKLVRWSPNPGPQSAALTCPAEIVLYGGAAYGGKLLSNSELVVTPYGFRKNGDLKVGEKVLAVDGSPTEILGIYPQGVKEIFEVIFDDGSSLRTGAEHLWLAWQGHQRKRSEAKLYRTSELKKGFRIPLCEPLQFTKSYRPEWNVRSIDPYVLGCLLGDGSFCGSTPIITTADKEIAQAVGGIFSSKKEGSTASSYLVYVDIPKELRGKRAWEKHIPKPYLWASVNDRWSLLQGLMDTDGTSDRNRGRISYCSTSLRLALDVRFLAESLGAKTRLRPRITKYRYKGRLKKGRRSWIVEMLFPEPRRAFRLARKQVAFSSRVPSRKVVAIRSVGKEEATCIQVRHPSGLYVAGERFIVTHNTDLLLIDAALNTQYDGYVGVIFRRTYKELEKHIIERAYELYQGIGKYNEKEFKWTFPTRDIYGKLNGGRSHIFLSYLDSEKDVFNHHGAAYQFIGFDESTMFSAFMVRYMLGRLRLSPASDPRIRKRMLLTTNPIGPGVGWHKLMFIEDTAHGRRNPYQIYDDAIWPDIGEPVRKKTCFIPAKIWDNPVGLKADPGYVDNLKSQGGAVARALLEGSWDERISMAVHLDKAIHTIDPIPIPKEAPRWIGIDWGKSDKACAVWETAFGGKVYFYRDLARPGESIVPFAQEVLAASSGEKIDFVVLSHEAFADRGQGLGHTQADQFVSVFSRADIPVINSGRDPEGRLMLLREFLRTTQATISDATKGADDYEYWQKRVNEEGEKAWKEYARVRALATDRELPRLQIFRRLPNNMGIGCPYLIQSFPLLTVDLEKPKKIAEGQDDHGFDAATYGLKAHVFYDETKVLDAYMKQIGGEMPTSGMAAELAMKAAQERVADEYGSGEDEPFQMQPEPYSDNIDFPGA